MTKFDHAKKLWGMGFHIFPVTPNQKSPPLISDFPNKATRSTAQIQEWWTKWPDANIGISTSKFLIEESLLVVDVDNKTEEKVGEAGLLELELAGIDFPATLEQTTPSGGRHLIYRVPQAVKQSVSKLARGIDIRSSGGYIIGAGSTIGERSYLLGDGTLAAAPEGLVSRCGRPSPKPESSTGERAPGVSDENGTIRAIHYLQTFAPISVQGAGGNHTAFVVAAKVKDFGVGRETAIQLLSEFWNAKCKPSWSGLELQTIVNNAYKYSENEQGILSPLTEFKDLSSAPAAERKKHLFVERFTDIKPKFNQPFLVHNLLSPGAMSVVYGESNSGKTFFALDMTLHIALGQEWMGKRTQKGLVIYVAAEGGWGIKKRIEAFRQHHKLADVDVPFALIPCSINLLDPKAHVQELIDLIQEQVAYYKLMPAVIVIDTLARAISGGNENAAEDMGAFVGNIDALRTNTKAHIMTIHHSGKDVARGARGHSSLRGATDTEIEIDEGRARVTKQRDMDFCGDIGFRLEQKVIGQGPDGDVTSCVVLPSNTSAIQDFSKEALDPESKAGRALSALRRTLDWDAQAAPDVLNLPEDTLVTHIESWRKEFTDNFASHLSSSTKRTSFLAGMKQLLEKGYINKTDELVWIS